MSTVSITIDEHGDSLFLVSEDAKPFLEEQSIVRRASHIEPVVWPTRVAFHALRSIFGDKGWMAAFTRKWPCRWRINTSPIGGDILPVTFRDRQQAIDVEIAYLNGQFMA